jgi:hypothetical protein
MFLSFKGTEYAVQAEYKKYQYASRPNLLSAYGDVT